MNETPKNPAAVTLGKMAAGVPKTVTPERQAQLEAQARKMTQNRMVAKAIGQKVSIARGVPSKILIPQRPEIIRPGAGLV